MEIIKIPEERVAVLVGEKGKTKEIIEKKADIKISVNREGEIVLEGNEEKVYFATDIIRAIGRGFNPQIALKLLSDDKMFFMINLKEEFNTLNAMKRIKARVIGEQGKIKNEIESATECDLSIYGKTISIIGNYDTIEYAKEAIYKIMKGAQHSTILNYLSEVKRKIIEERLK